MPKLPVLVRFDGSRDGDVDPQSYARDEQEGDEDGERQDGSPFGALRQEPTSDWSRAGSDFSTLLSKVHRTAPPMSSIS